jgi:hypothetical protein
MTIPKPTILIKTVRKMIPMGERSEGAGLGDGVLVITRAGRFLGWNKDV